ASSPMKQWSGSTLTLSPISLLRVLKLCFNWSSKTSAIAVRITLLSAFNAWFAAPVPRPPQPIRPTRRVSLLAPTDCWEYPRFAANTDPSAAVVDFFRNSRRELEEVKEVWSLIISLELWFIVKG